MPKPTPEEAKAIKEFKALAKRWPKSLWLFSASGGLHVMHKDADGTHAHLPNCGIDPAYIVDTIDIDNDGGDW